jgi:hypothetical protein
MADNFDMKKFLVENKLGAYSRLKEETINEEPLLKDDSTIKVGNTSVKIEYTGKDKDYIGFSWKGEDGEDHYEETRASDHKNMDSLVNKIKDEIGYSKVKENQLNEYEITYEYGSDGSCYRVDDEGNYDEVDDSYCRRYAGQGVREDKKEVEEVKDEVEESLDDEDAGGIETDIEMDLAYAENPIVYLKSIIDFCTKKIKEIEQNGSEDSEMQEAKKKEVKEALTPEAFERMDAIASNTAQIAMIKAAEIMMNQLTEEGFEVLDIREYFTQLIANDI